MSDFQPGEVVDITIKGARVLNHDTHGVLVFRYASDGEQSSARLIYPDAEGVTVERVAPAEWPPQPGDLWRGPKLDDPYGPDPIIWFARRDRNIDGGDDKLELVPADGDLSYVSTDPESVRRDFGPLALVRREAEQAADVDDEDPKTWTDRDGRVWDLTARYADREGNVWHYAGGFESYQDGPLVPLLSRDDWSITDVRITLVVDLHGPLTLVPCGCDHHGDHAGCDADCECAR